MALFSNKRNIKRAKEAAGQIQAASIRGMEIADTEKARSIAAETTKFSVLTSLGAPGTYGPGAPGTGAGGDAGGSIYDTSGTGLSEKDQSLSVFGNWGGGSQLEGAREGIIDPKAYTAELSKSSLFRQQSQQVAESEQLLNREGPLWDRLESSVLGTIHEGAALQLKDTMRRLKNNYAKGGSARRTSMNEFQTIMAEENAMRTRVQETWQANIRLNEYVQQNFERVRNGSMQFVDALPGLNESYRSAMQATAALAVQATKTAGIMAGQAYDLRMSQQAVNFGTKIAEALIQLTVSAIPVVGPALGSAIGSAKTANANAAAATTAARSGATGAEGEAAAAGGGGGSGLFGGIAEGLTGIFGGPQTSVSSVKY